MKILAINGSHRKGKNTAAMLETVLAEAAALGAHTELVELMDYEIRECTSCNRCLRSTDCAITDDGMQVLYKKMREADGIVIGSPVYFSNVTGRLKDFMDRSRPLHMVKNELEGKVGGALVHAGLRNGGQELALQIIHTFMLGHGIIIAADRGGDEEILSTGPMATMFESYDGGRVKFKRSVEEDAIALVSCRRLGQQMVRLLERLGVR